ncbi:MAG TPA: ATP-binding protein [Gammaproteobacteria bacterium]|nr:ATP-binding protein [Gammaproteobacteria bacterium]
MTTADTLREARETHTPYRPDMSWRLLALLNVFRLVAAVLLAALFFVDRESPLFGATHPSLFLWTITGYLAFTLLAVETVRRRVPRFELQAYAQFGMDIVAVMLLIQASGGLTSGLGALLFVSVAAASVTLDRRIAFLLAALAALGVLGQQFLANVHGAAELRGYTHAAVLGVIFFGTVLVGTWLAGRLQESEALAIRRGIDLQNLSQLNDYIIQHLQTGIVVLDQEGILRQMNASAAAMLGVSTRAIGRNVSDVAPQLMALVDAWNAGMPPATIRLTDGRTAIPHCMRLGTRAQPGVLIVLEDAKVLSERIQQTKLAALGRLTASIAHEVRNPLGAIGHANQLIAESPSLGAEERRFTTIIATQVERMNAMVNNILQLSRRDPTRTELLDIGAWLRDFVREYQAVHGLGDDALRLIAPSERLEGRFDPGQLHQVLRNLVDNAFQHAARAGMPPRVEIETGTTDPDNAAWIEVRDDGPGVPADVAEHIFEPFYSGGGRGTGLGLFIARELCECNGAELSHRPRNPHGSCFRITLASGTRWMI